MTVGIIVAIIAAILVIAVAAAVMPRRRGERGAAAAELRQLGLHRLDASAREYYVDNWTHVQGSFVDAPGMALESADSLVSQLLHDIGYPADDEQRLLRLLSVEHAPTVPAYRAARAVNDRRSAGGADVGTESMRVAVNGYDALFQVLVAAYSAPSDAATAQPRTEAA
jgi:hypothetical protein